MSGYHEVVVVPVELLFIEINGVEFVALKKMDGDRLVLMRDNGDEEVEEIKRDAVNGIPLSVTEDSFTHGPTIQDIRNRNRGGVKITPFIPANMGIAVA